MTIASIPLRRVNAKRKFVSFAIFRRYNPEQFVLAKPELEAVKPRVLTEYRTLARNGYIFEYFLSLHLNVSTSGDSSLTSKPMVRGKELSNERIQPE